MGCLLRNLVCSWSSRDSYNSLTPSARAVSFILAGTCVVDGLVAGYLGVLRREIHAQFYHRRTRALPSGALNLYPVSCVAACETQTPRVHTRFSDRTINSHRRTIPLSNVCHTDASNSWLRQLFRLQDAAAATLPPFCVLPACSAVFGCFVLSMATFFNRRHQCSI